MVKEGEEGEGTSRSGSAAVAADARSSFPPRKRLLAGLKLNGCSSPGSASSASSVQFRKRTRDLPNFSNCHACGSRMGNKGKDGLRTLDSEWRVVLVCKKCLDSVESAEICSYCFMTMSDGGARCRDCEHGVHRACILKCHGFTSCFDPGSGSFTCIDCWVPKSFANSNGHHRSKKPGKGIQICLGACSVGNSRVSAAGACSKSLEDVVKDANLAAEKKIAAAEMAREKAFKKALAARRAAELARNALDLAVVAAREENGAKDSAVSCASVVNDAELAFQLHQSMNCSPRISKNLCSMNSDCLHAPNIWYSNDNSLARASDPGSPSVCGQLEVCTDNKLFENPDKTVSEPSVRIGTLDHDSSTALGAAEANTKVDRKSSPQDKECKDNGEDSVMVSSEKGLEADLLIKKLENKDNKVELSMKEEEASCSNKLINSSGDDNSTDSGSQSYQKQDESEHKFSSNNSGTLCLLSCDGDSSMLQKKGCNEPDRYLRKYSKRHSSLKAVVDRKTKFLYEEFVLESQASVPGLPHLQLNCSKASRTFSDASFHSPSVPLQASAYASGPSGHQS